ncbi:MAG: hypothetical protein ACXVAX_00280 [Pseudobdellovibrio sp.]
MKKILSIFILISAVASLASAQYLVPGQPGSNSGPIFAPGSGRGPMPGGGFPGGPGGGPGWGHGPGGWDHGPGQPYPGNPYPQPYPNNPYPQPYPNNPYPPPPGPGYGDCYGPARTVRWQNMGSYVAQKIIETDVVVPGNGQFVNEIFLTAVDNPVQINSALVYLTNGQVVELRGLLTRMDRNQQLRQPLDYRTSLRVDRIELRIESPAIFGGSRGSLQVQLGLAF